ncbi:MAG: hypothetical protein HYY67_08645 [Thaumarchaeota archaeon]|nr:hypothetical protein [Nitrososphaerota archaeon]
MGSIAVIDHDILGWGSEQEDALLKRYKEIRKVGHRKDLPRRELDDKIALYCKENDCDLFTGDNKAYMHYFKAGIKTVKVSEYGWWGRGTSQYI